LAAAIVPAQHAQAEADPMATLRFDGMKTCAAAIDAERPMVARREERSDEESRSPPVALRSVTQHSAAHTAQPSSDRLAIEAAGVTRLPS
jgi:hypothetical protein